MSRGKTAAFWVESAIVVKGRCCCATGSPVAQTSNRILGSEGRAGLYHVASSRQRVGAEPALGECAGDGVVVIQRIKDIVHAERPEEPVIFPAQLEIDGGVGRNQRQIGTAS